MYIYPCKAQYNTSHTDSIMPTPRPCKSIHYLSKWARRLCNVLVLYYSTHPGACLTATGGTTWHWWFTCTLSLHNLHLTPLLVHQSFFPSMLLSSRSLSDLSNGAFASPSIPLTSRLLPPGTYSQSASFNVPRLSSTFSSCPCLLRLSLCQLICPPSASRCLCALSLAARIEVRVYTKRRLAMVRAARGAIIV